MAKPIGHETSYRRLVAVQAHSEMMAAQNEAEAFRDMRALKNALRMPIGIDAEIFAMLNELRSL